MYKSYLSQVRGNGLLNLTQQNLFVLRINCKHTTLHNLRQHFHLLSTFTGCLEDASSRLVWRTPYKKKKGNTCAGGITRLDKARQKQRTNVKGSNPHGYLSATGAAERLCRVPTDQNHTVFRSNTVSRDCGKPFALYRSEEARGLYTTAKPPLSAPSALLSCRGSM